MLPDDDDHRCAWRGMIPGHRPTAQRGHYRKAVDEELLPLIRRVIDERPTYGYRCVTALVKRLLAAEGKPTANHKRIFRIMKQQALLLQRHTGRRKGRLHDGKAVVMRSNLRWCSDVFDITCWNGDIVRIVFVIDVQDRKVLAWHAAAGTGIQRLDGTRSEGGGATLRQGPGATRRRMAVRQRQVPSVCRRTLSSPGYCPF
jgi:transposase InsO family protein